MSSPVSRSPKLFSRPEDIFFMSLFAFRSPGIPFAAGCLLCCGIPPLWTGCCLHYSAAAYASGCPAGISGTPALTHTGCPPARTRAGGDISSVIFCMELMLQMFFMMTVISMTSVSYIQYFQGSLTSRSQLVNSGKYCLMILKNAAKSFEHFFFSSLRCGLVMAELLCEKLFI